MSPSRKVHKLVRNNTLSFPSPKINQPNFSFVKGESLFFPGHYVTRLVT